MGIKWGIEWDLPCKTIQDHTRPYIYTYIHVQRLGFSPALQRRGFPFPIKCCCNFTFNWEDQQRY